MTQESSDRGVYLASESRRVFLRDAAAALLVSHPVLGAVTGRREVTVAQPSPFKTEAQYKLEAGRYDAAVRDISGALTMRLTSDADIPRLTTVIARAAADLDFRESWLVTLGYADPALVAWVRREIRDEATLLKFLDGVKRDPRVVDSISGVAALRARLIERSAADRGVIKKLLTSLEEDLRKLGTKLEADELAVSAARQEAIDMAGILNVTMIIVLVILIIIALVVSAFTFGGGAVVSAATSLGTAYKGAGADLAGAALVTTNQRYQQCVASASLLPEPRRARAILTCQGKWLAEKAPYLG